MNVVLDEAEEVWLKETKTKKVGDKATLGTF
jgi:small nuclear ribonucleoprotein (snRNP)-like protein